MGTSSCSFEDNPARPVEVVDAAGRRPLVSSLTMAAGLRLVPASGAPIEISQDQVLVGREPTCDVVLTDGSVSRKHARLEKRGRIWAVVDQGSANGTFVDSQRVTETTLRSGQEVRFGSVAFRVDIEGEEAAAATLLTDVPEATVVHPAPGPPPRPAAPAPPPPAPPPPPVRPPAAVPPTGSLPPGSIPPRVTAPPRPPGAARSASRPPALPSESMAPAPAPPKKGRGPLFWVATGCCSCMVLVVAVVAVLGGAAFHMTADAVAAVRGQLADLKAGNIDAAYARFSEDYQARVSREEFEVLVSRHAALRENADSTFWKRSIENDKGAISGVLTSTSGAHETVSYRLAKEGGVWKVSDIEFGASP
jgi:pSer/pThr/pTyr-binding forkhead associated (FHA) protein